MERKDINEASSKIAEEAYELLLREYTDSEFIAQEVSDSVEEAARSELQRLVKEVNSGC